MPKLMIALILSGGLLVGCTTQTTTSRSAADVQREADYRAALQQCDQLGSAQRATCIEDAKTRYGHS